MSSNKGDIYSILADQLKKIKEARHPLAKIIRRLLAQRGINKISWDRLTNEYINNDPDIVNKKLSSSDRSQERSRINRHIADPDMVTYRTLQKFAKVAQADNMIVTVTLQWYCPDTQTVEHEVTASASELTTIKKPLPNQKQDHTI